MSFITIESTDDERLALFRLRERGLTNRADKRDDAGAGMFLAEGDLVVSRAHAAGCRAIAALADADRVPPIAHDLGVDVFIGGDEIRRMVTGLGMPHPIVAIFERPPRPSAISLLSQSRRLVIVEAVDNPANIGGIVRNAAGLGWDGLLLDGTSGDPLSRRALRVAMGTTFALPHARTRDLMGLLDDECTRGQRDLIALTPDPQAADLRELAASLDAARPRAVMIGAERAGLSDDALRLAIPARIPMAGAVDSLNAAAASAIACWALA
jgi:tRNA G18 (ribose-2'-O)-methylase SpoU